MQKRKGISLLLLMVLALLAMLPEAVYAQSSPPPPLSANGVVCGDYADKGFVERVVTCMQNTILLAGSNVLMPVSQALANTIAVVCVMAIMFFGIRVMIGRQRRIMSDGVMLMIKLALVSAMCWNFGDLMPVVFDLMTWLVTASTAYASQSAALQCHAATVWQTLDCALDRIIGGFLPGSTMAFGMLGFLVAAIFSGPVGFTIFLFGVGVVYTILMSIFRAVYVYLSALIGIVLMIIVSPLFIPLVLFRVTKGYFQKWMRLFFGLMLQPIFLFAYLAMLTAAFDVVIFSGPKSLFATIASYNTIQQPNFRIGNYVMDSYVKSEQLATTVTLDPSKVFPQGLEQTGTFGVLQKSVSQKISGMGEGVKDMFPAQLSMNAIDFQRMADKKGDDITVYIVKVLMAMLMAVVVGYIFNMLMQQVPYLGTMLSGEIMSLPDLSQGFDKSIKDFGQQISPKTSDIERFEENMAKAAQARGGADFTPAQKAAPNVGVRKGPNV